MVSECSEVVVYADESSDHGLLAIKPQYPAFALAFCALRKDEYTKGVWPAFQRFKFGIGRHDTVVLQEHHVRKSKRPFALLPIDWSSRERFYSALNGSVEAAPMRVFAAVIDIPSLRA